MSDYWLIQCVYMWAACVRCGPNVRKAAYVVCGLQMAREFECRPAIKVLFSELLKSELDE